jgi:hypothetical protein
LHVLVLSRGVVELLERGSKEIERVVAVVQDGGRGEICLYLDSLSGCRTYVPVRAQVSIAARHQRR